MRTEQATVTVLGLGLMGQALAGAFLAGGHRTTIWNRSAGKAGELVARGAREAGPAAAAVAASDLVVVCVTDNAAARELLGPLAGALAGRVLVNLTSGTSAQARETAEWAAAHDIRYLDGVILAIPQAIGTDEAVVLYSGPRDAFDTHQPTLLSLGPNATYLDADHGLSALYDMAVLTMMWNVLNGFLHGAALLGTAKVPAAALAPFVNQLIGSMTGWITAYAGQVDDGAYPAVDATLDIHLASMDHLIEESDALGVNAELPRFTRSLAARAVANGHGGDGYAAMIEQFRMP